MSEKELYEIAERRIDQRNRRWTFWAIDLLMLIFILVGLIVFGRTGLASLAAALFLGWGGVFTIHTILLAMAESRAKDIEKEVVRLRTATYEKPKRLEIDDEGELVDFSEWEEANAQRSRYS